MRPASDRTTSPVVRWTWPLLPPPPARSARRPAAAPSPSPSPSPSADSLRAALDCLGDAVVLLDRTGRLLLHNSAADALLAAQVLLRLPDGRLGLPWAEDEIHLLRTLRGLRPGARPAIEHLRDRHGQLCGVLKVFPGGGEAHATVLVRRLGGGLPSGGALPASWDVTPAEAQLAGWLVEGFSLDQVVRFTGLSKNTLRTQLRALFEKTGTHRQAQLVCLLQLCHV